MSMKEIPDALVCLAYERVSKGTLCSAEILLKSWTKQPEEVCERACKRAEEHGLIVYGVPVKRSYGVLEKPGWLTEKGKNFIADWLEERRQLKELKFASDYSLDLNIIRRLAEELNMPIVTATQKSLKSLRIYDKLLASSGEVTNEILNYTIQWRDGVL